MNARPTSPPRRGGLAAVLVLVLASTAAAVVACGDGSAPAPPTRTLTPEADQSPGKRGSTTSNAPSATPTTGPTASASATPKPTRITDKTIRANILARIAQEPGLRGFEILVMVSDGNVYLRGRVRTKEQRSLVEQIALTEPGVKKVVSSIDVDDAAGY